MQISRMDNSVFIQMGLFDLVILQVLFIIFGILPILTVISIFI